MRNQREPGVPMPPSIAIEIENVEVRYGRRRALGPVSLTLHRGEFLGVVGPNGAGKSTLLRVLAGLQPVHDGGIRLFGKAVATRRLRRCRALARDVGFLFQRHDFTPELPFTVEDVVRFGRVHPEWLRFRFSAEDQAAVETALQSLGLSSMRSRLYRELSGGERQKVQFARLLAQEARILLLDEPTAGLDLDARERVTTLAAEMRSTFGKTVIMVTHEVDRLPADTDKVLLLDCGRVAAFGPPEAVLTPRLLARAYRCPVVVLQQNGRFHAFATPDGDATNTGGE